MSTIRQYFDTDFDHALRINVEHTIDFKVSAAKILCDMSLGVLFLSFYFEDSTLNVEQFKHFLSLIKYNSSRVELAGDIQLPSASSFHGTLKFENLETLNIAYHLFGDSTERNALKSTSSGRIFIYSETSFSVDDVRALQSAAESFGHILQFRDKTYERERTMLEKPLAFISHDSGDKDKIARPIAQNLQRMLCPVWYDEYSLPLGSNLRESIEKGLRETKKCVLLLSPNFLNNRRWAKKEFESVFIREIIEDSQVVLPIWCGVTEQQVYDYSPSLALIKGISWDLGEDEVCRQIYLAVKS